jgi:hypothetical protein
MPKFRLQLLDLVEPHQDVVHVIFGHLRAMIFTAITSWGLFLLRVNLPEDLIAATSIKLSST